MVTLAYSFFLECGGRIWRTSAWLIKNGGKEPETKWCQHLGSMTQVSLGGYAVGGAFLSLAYFDLPYNALVMVVLARNWMERKAWLDRAAGHFFYVTGTVASVLKKS